MNVEDICRICHCEGTPMNTLFYPCICSGTIKYMHQDCLMEWIRYSRKQNCELCGHHYRFLSIYSPNMPRVLPIRDVLDGLLSAVIKKIKSWLHYLLVVLIWFGLLPVTVYRAYGYLFHTVHMETFSTENLLSDAIRGCSVLAFTLISFVGLLWLHQQILHGVGQDWFEHDEVPDNAANANVAVADVIEPALFAAEAMAEQPINNAVPPEAAGRPDVDNDNEWPNWAEEMILARFLGLDGSFVFLEFVFLIILLSTMLIFIFAFCPYCIGNFILNSLGMMLHFHALLTTLFGYCLLGLTFVLMYCIARMFHLHRIRSVVGYCYIVVKVSLLYMVGLGVQPLIYGYWMDLCTLPLFDATLKDRKASFHAAPGTSLFVHWMFGIVAYNCYFSAFISLLSEVLRPGVLWFLPKFNDPNLRPIQNMIHLPILRHVKRIIASAMIFGFVVMLILWLPIRILKMVWPTFLPCTISGDAEKVNDLSFYLLVLQVLLRQFFAESDTRVWVKGLLRIWCIGLSWMLGIRSYLLKNEIQAEAVPEAAFPPMPEEEIQYEERINTESHTRPSLFALRICILILLVLISLIMASLVTIIVSVWLGRPINTILSVGGIITSPKLYSAALGFYLYWILVRAVAIAVILVPLGRAAIIDKLKQWLQVATSTMTMFILICLLSIIRLLFGLLVELVVVIPLRVPWDETPVHSLRKCWEMGEHYIIIAIVLTLMGPDWHMQRALDRAYHDGIRNIDMKFIIKDIAAPIIMSLGLALAVPYVLAHTIMPLFVENVDTLFTISRAVYPFCFVVLMAIGYVYFQINQFKNLYMAIKVDKYLVGYRLVNYVDNKRKQEAEAAAALRANAAK